MDILLSLLKRNARLTNKELAAMADMTESEVAAKIKEYEKSGAIIGYSAVLNNDIADKSNVSALIEVKVTPKADCGFDDIAKTIMMYDEVESLTLMSGTFDLAVKISGQDFKDLALFVAQKLSTINGVIGTSTHFFLKSYKKKGIIIGDGQADPRGFVSP